MILSIRQSCILLLLLSSLTTHAQKTKKNPLLGKWAFEQFLPKKGTHTNNDTLAKAALNNKKLTFTFTSTNKIISTLKGTPDATIPYQILKDNKHILIAGDTCQYFLNKKQLRISYPNSPDAMFRKVK